LIDQLGILKRSCVGPTQESATIGPVESKSRFRPSYWNGQSQLTSLEEDGHVFIEAIGDPSKPRTESIHSINSPKRISQMKEEKQMSNEHWHRYCECCGEPYDLRFHHELVNPDMEGRDLLDHIQGRLEVARRLDQAGWTLRPTPQGFACEPPPEDERDVEVQLADLGFDDDEIAEGLLIAPIRTLDEISEAAHEFHDRVWYGRKLIYLEEDTDDRVSSDIIAGMLRSMLEVEQEYGLASLQVESDFDWGMINGKLSALRWVLGLEWDFLDT
jgi:hypothetical protein